MMKVMECLGRMRACATCGRKIEDTNDFVFFDRNLNNVFCFGGSADDRGICVDEWVRVHKPPVINLPDTAREIRYTFDRVRISDVETYLPWPGLGACLRR